MLSTVSPTPALSTNTLMTIKKRERLTVHEAVAQQLQGRVLLHDGVLEDGPPEHSDVLRSLSLHPVQSFIESFLQLLFTLHAFHLLHTHESMGQIRVDLKFISRFIVMISLVMIYSDVSFDTSVHT